MGWDPIGDLEKALLGTGRKRRKKSHPVRSLRRAHAKWLASRAKWAKERQQIRQRNDIAKKAIATSQAAKRAQRDKRRKERLQAAEARAKAAADRPSVTTRPVIVKADGRWRYATETISAAPDTRREAPSPAAKATRTPRAGECGQPTEDGTPCERLGDCPYHRPKTARGRRR